MFPILKLPPRRKAWIRCLTALACACGSASAQNFTLQVADSNPLGIGNFVPSRLDLGMDSGIEGGIKGAFGYGVGLETVYDSNFQLAENNEESEVSALFIPWLSYVSDPEGGASVSLTANYKPTFRAFLENSDLNGVDQSADATLSFVGGRTEVSLFARYNELSGTDRLTGTFTSGSLLTGGVRATRGIAPRTSLNGGLSYAQSDYSSGDIEGSRVFTGYVGGLWSATERTSIGSSIRYTQSESDNTGTRDAWALLAEVRYRLGERIWLSASLGPEFSKNSESGDNTISLSGDIQARYVINERWSWVNSLRTATVPSPSETGYVVNNVNITTELEHQLLRATLSGGVEFNYSDYESVGEILIDRENEENLGFFLSYNRNLFSDRIAFDSTLRYAVNNGASDWSQWQISAGLNIPF